MKIRAPYLILITSLLFFGSCSKYQRILKSTDNNFKYETALAYYEKKDYYRALQLFDQLMPAFKGTEREEKLAYYYGYAYYYQEDYILSGYYFKRFARDYPSSKFAEECYFMNAYCNYLNSPGTSLDQTSSIDAIREFQTFINKYPTSDRVNRANELIDKLRGKLETKAFNIGMLYFKTEDFRAAIVSFNNLLKDFPETGYRELTMFHIIKSYSLYAEYSVASKRAERHQGAIGAYNDFKALFPDSRYMKDATDLVKVSQNFVTNNQD
ncbi:MAG: outer membrane protein assembly factor BamD [Bacteroidales bacterium]|nr:outer membrane protein assembly factor BamD [Bacteroidales bacterium]